MISVIVILFYSKHLVDDLIINLKQIINQNLGEIVLVNNSVQEKFEEFEEGIVRVVNCEKNLGYGGGINLGVNEAKHERLVIINPDLKFMSFDFSISIHDLFLAGGYNNEVPYGSKFPPLIRDTFRLTFRRIFPYKILNFILDLPHQQINSNKQYVDYFSGSLIITNKKTFNLLNGFDPEFFLFYEEIDLCKRANEKKIDVFITKSVEYSHKITSSASSNNVSKIKILNELISFFKYHNKYSGSIVILSKCWLILFTLLFLPIFSIASIFFRNRYLLSRRLLLSYYFQFLVRKYHFK